MRETNIIQSIRLACSDIALLFRNNTGVLPDKNGRPVRFGLAVGSGDIVGLRKSDARFISLEIKQPGKKPTPEQINFITAIQKNGGLSGVATNVEEARKIILGK